MKLSRETFPWPHRIGIIQSSIEMFTFYQKNNKRKFSPNVTWNGKFNKDVTV